jgi:hypothetical protein
MGEIYLQRQRVKEQKHLKGMKGARKKSILDFPSELISM